MIRDDNVLLQYSGVSMRLESVVPVRDYVLIQLDSGTGGGSGSADPRSQQQPLTTKSGVVIASAVMKDDVPCQGRVVRVGEGRLASTGTLTPSPVRAGDMVKFKDYAGNDVTIEGRAYSVVKMVDILCTYTLQKQTAEDDGAATADASE
jgi:co-chaperonin GroES (HSP10)